MGAIRAINLMMAAMMAGGLTMVMLALVPTFHRLPARLAVELHRGVDRYVDVPLPIFTVLTFVTSIPLVLGGSSPAGARVLVAAAAGGAVVVALSSHLINRPMNLRVKSWDPDRVPAEYAGLRRAWDRAHAFRTVAGVCSLVCLIVAMLLQA